MVEIVVWSVEVASTTRRFANGQPVAVVEIAVWSVEDPRARGAIYRTDGCSG